MSQGGGRERTSPAVQAARMRPWQRLLPWVVTLLCFLYLYRRLDGAAAAEGRLLLPYLGAIFESVSWPRWLMLMVPYGVLFLAIDSLVVWRVITWFNARLRYTDVLPIRASAYILSLVNEQVSKGAIALYLNRRDGIPGWEVGSSMLFIMFCEYYYLLTWATVGVALQWDRFPAVLHLIPWIALGSGLFFVLFHLFFSGRIRRSGVVRDRPIFRSFRLAKVRHYATVVALRSPAMLAAVVVYALALRLFGVNAGVGEMLGYLPVIFFGAATPGPMHSVAIVLWVMLFPERPGVMATFGFVQHNFFVLFNAGLGLLFLRRATRDLFAPTP
jgi:hypothetical protein